MRRTLTILIVVFFIAASAAAGNVHLKGGKEAKPAFGDSGLVLESTGALAGLGNEDVTITLEATGDPTAVCKNPGGSNEPPGHNPAPITVTGSQSIPKEMLENGNVSFEVATDGPKSPVPGAPDCPNKRWSQVILDMAFTSATITVEQGGKVVLEIDVKFRSPTTDGLVPDRLISTK